jgi:hypothetical protein
LFFKEYLQREKDVFEKLLSGDYIFLVLANSNPIAAAKEPPGG